MTRRKIKHTAKTRSRSGIPEKKISQTLIEFAEPILDFTDDDVGPDEYRSMFKVVVTIWNAVTLEQSGDSGDFVEKIRHEIGKDGNPFMTALIDNLINRKRSLFSHDPRLVGHYELIFDGSGEFKLRAEARIKESLMDVN